MNLNEKFRSRVVEKINDMNNLSVIYFTKRDDIAILNRAALYVLTNEQTTNIKVVFVYQEEKEIPSGLVTN